MSSFIYYKFRSSRGTKRVTFDGTGITIFDLKREILHSNHLESTAESFNIELSSPETQEVYDDDAEVLPRSSSVEVRRIPVRSGQARYSAARYVSGNITINNARNAQRREEMNQPTGTQESATNLSMLMPTEGVNEEDMVNMMFAAQGEEWSRTQQEMAAKTPVYAPRRPTQNVSGEPDKTVPAGYICHRCGQKGHWIQNCPTLNDPNFEAKKIRRTTGIPRSMLRTIEAPTNDEKGTYMMTADGEYVVAVADDRAWQEFQRRQKLQEEAAKRAIPAELQDPETHELMIDPKTMPCCGKTYSDASIQNLLISTDFKCPNCGQEEVYLDQLVPNADLNEQVVKFSGSNSKKSKADSEMDDRASSDNSQGANDREPDEQDNEDVSMDSDSEYDPDAFTRKRRRLSVSSVESAVSIGSIGSVGSSGSVSSGRQDTSHNTHKDQDGVPNNMPSMPFFPFMFPPLFMPFAYNNNANGADAQKEDIYRRIRGRPILPKKELTS